MPRKFKVAFSGCPEDCIATAINDVGLRAIIRDGVKGFSMTVAGGLGPLPVEAKLLHEFIPAEDIVRRVEAVLRVFNVHGNRKDKNKARLKFVLRARGFEWLRDTDRGAVSGHPGQRRHPHAGRSFPKVSVDFSQLHHHPRRARMLPALRRARPNSTRWRETNVRPQKQPGYAIVTVMTPQGNLTGDQMRGLAEIAEQAADSTMRVTMAQNIVFAYVPVGALQRVYGALQRLGLDKDRAR